MDVTGKNTDTITGSGLTSEASDCRATGNYKWLTVRPTEDKEGLFNPANYVSDNAGVSESRSSGPDGLFSLSGCTVSHSRAYSPKTIGREAGAEDNQKVALSFGQVGQPKLLELLTSKQAVKPRVEEALEKLARQFDKLHVNVSTMDKVNELKREIKEYIDTGNLTVTITDTYIENDFKILNGSESVKKITNDIQETAREIAIWAGVEKNNLKVLTYIIEQGFPIEQKNGWVDLNPESTVYLPFDTMEKLVGNCKTGFPDLLFVKAIFADADPRFDVLFEAVLNSIYGHDELFQEAIAQSIPAASYRRLMFFFNYLRCKCNARDMIRDLITHSFEYHRIAMLYRISKYHRSIVLVFVLEAIAQQSQKEAQEQVRKIMGSFCQDEQQVIAMIAILGGLHQCAELLTEIGITVTRQAFIEASVNLENSPFLMAKEAGLTNERLFVNTVNRVAPFLWTLPDKFGQQLDQECFRLDKKAMSFIQLVIEQMPICLEEGDESKYWSGPNYINKLVLGDVSLWAAKIFSAMNDTGLSNRSGLLKEDDRYCETWNTLISQVGCCNGLTRPYDFMKFMDWLLMEGLSWVRAGSEYREQEATFSLRLKSYRPDLWPDPGYEASTTSSALYNELVEYSHLVTNLHFDIIESFLRLAPPSHRIHVLNNWLNNPDCAKQREVLFCRSVYPLNTMGSPNIWQLLLSLDKDYQPQENQFDNDWKKLSNPQQWTAPPSIELFTGESVEVYGRTLAIQRTDGGWDYLKFLSDTEKPEELAREGNKITLMAAIADQHGLKSSIPEVVGRYHWNDVRTDLVTLIPPTKKAKLEEKCRYIDGKTGYCLHLKSTKDAPYHLYPYVLDPVTNSDQILEGLYKYAHDCGVLFNYGLYAPAVMAADHDSVTRRKHHVLSSYVDAASEGRMLQWKKASQYPNVGPVGMRDTGDTKTINELGEDYFFSSRCQKFLDFEQSEDRAKVAFSELAKNAQGLVLQYALCFQKQFNSDSRESILNHERKIKVILATLFQKAFPQFTEECVGQAMNEDELLSQAVREVVYWCGKGKFVNDIMQNIIPKSTYPGCSETTNIVDFTTLQPRELVPGVGFVTRDNEPNLGVTFGVNPLVTLNALIVKLLAKGALTSL
ncbi:hypothetical protein [Endozoicomonas sp. ISHI1]|uniref:hypothetical protein n=1 Tax=Endozoicomonas sp. ISHI1 TaxID=2825882 RepID=UPI00214813CE|nr:hypothetical protein [Endozoicomonas sp. ISHI1]